MTRTVVGIDGMACGMCESHVNDTVRRNFHVKSVKASHKKKQAEIISAEPLDVFFFIYSSTTVIYTHLASSYLGQG